MLKLQLHDRPDSMVPDLKIAAQAAARGMEVLIIGHLRQKNDTTSPRAGFPKTDYYADAADSVSCSSAGPVARVEVDHPGLAMHYEGGTVYPKKKALAIPVDPSVAGIWPSEYTGMGNKVFKTKSGNALADAETGNVLWILVPKATIPADKSVLPTDDDILGAAEEAIWELVS